MKRFLKSSALVLAGLSATVTSVQAATYTYDFDFTFASTGDNVGGFRDTGAGGALEGFFTINENNEVIDFDFDFQVIQRAGRFEPAQTDDVSLDLAGGDFFGTAVTPAFGGNPEFTTFGFSETDNHVQCTFRNAVGAPFSLSFKAANFTAGNANVNFEARSARSSPYCNQFGALTFDTRQPQGQTQISGSVTGALREPTVSAVPLPAGLPLMLAGFGALAAMRRRAR